jgi:hypothetical protein
MIEEAATVERYPEYERADRDRRSIIRYLTDWIDTGIESRKCR